ncbi:dipeptide ABC transporter ATP-binding protein [Actinomadura syzygii]|uniref:ABC transporter ATP-binding protein n=1 Tax=Actinomadura syzygii TaxID=1427538 RepID=A0A5D0UJ13_9ACTN|nr:ABC transporter ATP-binding protein [Actinomadura syzygii]TYC18491.1 ABC transporter ATP-binding protein [Actinomadura syzygii]
MKGRPVADTADPAAPDGADGDPSGPVLAIRNLTIGYGTGAPSVRGVDLSVRSGEIVGLIGESGSGKSSVALGCLGLLPKAAEVTADELTICGTDVLAADERTLTRMRGDSVAMVFQDAMGALDPSMRIGNQIAEVVTRHRGVKRAEARAVVRELLDKVGVPEPDRRARQYPHQLSGGLRQRAAVALALAGDPALLLADEPTTALDVTVQAGILELFRTVRDEFGVGIVLISHDIGVIAQTADRVAVMLDGEIVEHGGVEEVLLEPKTEYTRMLLRSVPHLDRPRDEPESRPVAGKPLYVVDDVSRTYRSRGRLIHAVQGVSLDVREGEVLGVVGESGSGKSTLAKMLVHLERPDSGRLTMSEPGHRAGGSGGGRAGRLRRRVQMVFQHPAGSLNPRLRVGTSVREPLAASDTGAKAAAERVREVLREVGLPEDSAARLPDEFSGGQKQRIAIARAIVGDPRVVVLDEPTSALDVSVQAQVLDLLSKIQRAENLTYVFISHDLAVVRAISDRVAVMYAGRLVELADAASLFEAPAHWYTRELLAAMPSPDPRDRPERPERRPRAGQAESGQAESGQGEEAAAPAGCAFASRCPAAEDNCRTVRPEPVELEPGRVVACHHPAGMEGR